MAASLLCLVLLGVVLRLGEADLRLPLHYLGDSITFLTKAKAIVQGEWIHHNSRIGMPFGADWTDFPLNVTLDSAWIWLLSHFTNNAALLLNVYWLLGIATGAGLATYCLVRLKVTRPVAAAIGIIYALQPYTFYRGISHLHVMVHLVPLMAGAAIELALGNFACAARGRGLSARVRAVPVWLWVACVAVGLSYPYTVFFSSFVIITAALLAYLARRDRQDLLVGIMLAALISISAVADLSPTLVRNLREGVNPSMEFKMPSEAEVYGLKLRFLVTPIPNHPFPPLRYIEQTLKSVAFPLDTENESARLGTLGAIGFVILIGFLFAAAVRARVLETDTGRVLGVCGALVLACVLMATVGGAGDIFNTFVTPDIRCYNRIAPFISFFCLMPVALLLSRVHRAWSRYSIAVRFGSCTAVSDAMSRPRSLPAWWFHCTLALCVVAGAYDQTVTPGFLPHSLREGIYRGDREFVQRVDSIMPQDAMIYQLPYADFPVEHLLQRMINNDQGRPYVHSTKCRWSWGALTGSTAAEWNRQAASRPLPEMLHKLVHRGYVGVWLDLFGYTPQTSPESGLTGELSIQPLRSPDGRFLFYDIRPYAARLLGAETPSPILAQHPVDMTFERGFYEEERDAVKIWRWCRKRGRLVLVNSLNVRRKVRLAMSIQTGYQLPQTIHISGPEIDDYPSVALLGDYARDVVVPPNGQAVINFSCNCKRAADPRSVYFGVLNVKVTDE
jgi:phosphoglycerol transferase